LDLEKAAKIKTLGGENLVSEILDLSNVRRKIASTMTTKKYVDVLK
jgi:hypothetical protein